MFRLKQLFGGHLKNHRFDPQTTEAYARLAALNILTRLGMPETVPVCSTDAPVPFTTLQPLIYATKPFRGDGALVFFIRPTVL